MGRRGAAWRRTPTVIMYGHWCFTVKRLKSRAFAPGFFCCAAAIFCNQTVMVWL